MTSFIPFLSVSMVIVKLQIGRLTERETKENEGQGERVTECEATVARQGADDWMIIKYDCQMAGF